MSKHSDSSGQLDLSKKGAELEKIFDSVINKIPDLSPPLAYRLAGEEDFFNRTKDLRLAPFNRDKIFSAVTHNCNQADEESLEVQANKFLKTRPRASSSCGHRQEQYREYEDELRSKSSIGFCTSSPMRRAVVSPWHGSRCTTPFSTTSTYRLEVETKELYEARRRLNKHYSGMKIKHSKSSGSDASSYDCLFTDWSSDEYPYANPMPKSMLAKENVDNLRNIIVSAEEVEWKMLTPVRPSSEYEEKFFDKLIGLHRSRYQLQKTELTNKCSRPAFKHKRHRLLVRYDDAVMDAVGFKTRDRRQCVRCVGNDSATVCAGVKWRRRMRMFKRHQRRQSLASTNVPQVPILTLTSADQAGSNQTTPIICTADDSSTSSSSSDNEYHRDYSKSKARDPDDTRRSRHRRVNLLSSSLSIADHSTRQPQSGEEKSSSAGDPDFEHRVQDMLSTFMSSIHIDESI